MKTVDARMVPVGQWSVAARQSGQGPDVLFLHGFPTSSLDWEPVIGRLNARCTRFDFLGFGDSEKPRIRYNYDLQVEAICNVAKAYNLERVIVVAHDYGATAAQELMARAKEGKLPFTIDGVVFLNGGLAPELHHALLVQRLLASPIGPLLGPLLLNRRTYERSMRRIIKHTEHFDFDANWAALARNGGVKIVPRLLHYMRDRREHRSRWVEALHAPIPKAAAWGMDDSVSGAHVLKWLRSWVGADLPTLELPGVGHYPHVEAEAQVAAFIGARIRQWRP